MGVIVKLTLYGAAIVMAMFAFDEIRAGPLSLAGDTRHSNSWLFWTIVGSELLLSGLLTLSAALT